MECRLAEVIRLTPVVLRLPGAAARPQASPTSKRWCNNFPKGWRNGGGADWLETAKTGCRASKKRADVALEGFAARGNRHEPAPSRRLEARSNGGCATIARRPR